MYAAKLDDTLKMTSLSPPKPSAFHSRALGVEQHGGSAGLSVL